MLKSYILTAWRNLLKSKFYSLLNIAGLTAGLAVGILILLWVQDEKSYDNFHSKAANIYRLENKVGTGSSEQIWAITVAPIGPLAVKELPVVRDQARITYAYSYSHFGYGDKEFDENQVSYTDPSFFTIFDYPLIAGNCSNPFPDIHSMVMTESTARKYFGNADPIGKTVLFDHATPFTVTGLIKDMPANSSFRQQILLPMSLLEQDMYGGDKSESGSGKKTMLTDFSQFNYATYLLLQPGANVAGLTAKLNAIHLHNKPDDTDLDYLLLPLSKLHLYKADGTDNGISTVRMFTLVAVLILVIACINNVNLSTARSMLRSKEVSLRKIVGADRVQLFFQFIVETALLFCFAGVLALGLIKAVLPLFNQLTDKRLVLHLGDPHIMLVIGATILSTLAVSSVYPALLLSSFKPIEAMKGKIMAGVGSGSFRRVLVVVQFVFSMILIVGTLVINQQLNFVRNRQLGYDKDHVMSVYMMRGMDKHYDAIRSSLLRQRGVLGVTRGNSSIVRLGPQTGDIDYQGKEAGSSFMAHTAAIDQDFFGFFKMKLLQGANFTNAASDSGHFIVNETAARQMGFVKDPIGKQMRMWQYKGTIVGVVQDFHFASMREKIGPVVFYYRPADSKLLYIRTNSGGAAGAAAAAEAEWRKYNAGYGMTSWWLDEEFRALYRSDRRTGDLFKAFSLVAILISCLGLFGLAAYTAQVRTREIGVRKVLGATVADVLKLLGTDFIRLVAAGILIAVPLAWYAMHRWLEDYAYKITLGWGTFVLAATIALVVALVTISSQAIRAALANPVESLKI